MYMLDYNFRRLRTCLCWPKSWYEQQPECCEYDQRSLLLSQDLTCSFSFGLTVGETAPLSHTSVPNSHCQTDSSETQLSISPNRWVTGITRLRFLSKALLCCIVKTPTLTCAWKHGATNFYTLFIRDATSNWQGVFPAIKERRVR